MNLADMERMDFTPPDEVVLATAPEGFRPIILFPDTDHLQSFLSGDPESLAVRVRYFWREIDGVLHARAWFGPRAKGPPGHAHGGSIAALLDESMGCVAWQAGHPVLAARINVSFRRSVPLGRIYQVEAWVERATGRKFSLVAKLSDQDGGVFAESEGLFVELNEAQRTEMDAYRAEMDRTE